MRSFSIEDIAGTLGEFFRDKEEIFLAFVFGSAAAGNLKEGSDVDIAVLFENRPNFHDVLKITNAVSELTGREADIVVLNDSSPVIRMQVLKKGKLIKVRNAAIYNNFYVRTVKEYDDLKHVRKEAETNILRGRIYA